MEIQEGQIIFSRAGRDIGHAYMVLRIKGDRLWVADGRKRTLEAPKQKNIRHINPTGSFVPESERGEDRTLRAALKALDQGNKSQEQGG